MVWIIPIFAAVVAVGIAIQRIMSEGPTIAIIFKAAEGVEAGKTFVKYKDVNIGQVTAVQLSPDYSKVEVTAKIAKSAAGLMVEDAMFWVVNRASLSAACRALAHCCRGTSSDLRPEHPKSSSVLSLDWNFSRL